MKKKLTILAIETSCDETSVAIVDSDRNILANKIYSQIERHKQYNGVVPEIAARAHFEKIEEILHEAIKFSGKNLAEIDAIAVTAGPGLIGGLIVGLMVAKAISYSSGIPLIGVNHLEGHILTPRLIEDIKFPYLVLLISGGHCQFLSVEKISSYHLLGTTIDDALGEAFDKVSKMLGLSYPGGPIVENYAKSGNELAYKFPIPLKGREGCDMSFSGLKTAVRSLILKITDNNQNELLLQNKYDICASFQFTIKQILNEKIKKAMIMHEEKFPSAKRLIISGGVAANQYLRESIIELCKLNSYEAYFPPINLCTDNAAMIAWAAIEYIKSDNFSGYDGLDLEPKARWSLER